MKDTNIIINSLWKSVETLEKRITSLTNTESSSSESTFPYKVYSALVNQEGTNPPVSTILQNTLGGVPVWSRFGTGFYFLTLADAFTVGKTACLAQTTNSSFFCTAAPEFEDPDKVSLAVDHAEVIFIDPNWVYATGGIEDGKLWETFFEIRVYP